MSLDIHEEHVLPRSFLGGMGLDKGHIDLMVAEDGKRSVESAGLMGYGEYHRGLVFAARVDRGAAEDEEAGAYVKCETITEEGLESNYLYESDELELVTEEITEQENKPQVANVPTMDVFALHDELNKYIVSIVDSLRKQGCTDRICVRIKCEHYTGDDAEITYGVEIKYGDTVNSGNLGQSAQVAWSRIQENKRLEVKAIPFYVDESP